MNKMTQTNTIKVKVICSYCKKCLHREESWEKDMDCWYDNDSTTISHGICPDCLLEHFPEEYLVIQEERKIRIKKLFEKGFKELYGHLVK